MAERNSIMKITGVVTSVSEQFVLLNGDKKVLAKYPKVQREQAVARARVLGADLKQVESGCLIGATRYFVEGKEIALPDNLLSHSADGEVYNPSINIPEVLPEGTSVSIEVDPAMLSLNAESKTFAAKSGEYSLEQVQSRATLADYLS